MTGFSQKTASLPVDKGRKISFYVEMKSINSRSVEILCRMPSFLNALEIKMVKKLKGRLLRGRVYLLIRTLEDGDTLKQVVPSLNVLKGYVEAVGKIKKEFKISGNLTISDILSLPDSFISQSDAIGQNGESAIL